MAHDYAWPSGTTGKGVGECQLCGVTLQFVAAGPRGGQRRLWRTPAGEDHIQGRAALDGEPACVNGAVGPKPSAIADTEYAAMSPEHKRGLAELMWRAREIATGIPSAKRLMVAQIKHLAFYWTTSASCPVRCMVIPDSIKHSVHHLRHTADAHRVLVSGEGAEPGETLVHEHAVPRSRLAEYIVEDAKTVEEVIATLEKYCVAVLVTVEEDRRLSKGGLRERMPTGWKWGDDLLARYTAVAVQVFDGMATSVCSCIQMSDGA